MHVGTAVVDLSAHNAASRVVRISWYEQKAVPNESVLTSLMTKTEILDIFAEWHWQGKVDYIQMGCQGNEQKPWAFIVMDTHKTAVTAAAEHNGGGDRRHKKS